MFIDSIKVVNQTEALGYSNNQIQTGGERLVLEKFLKGGQVVFDVGANTGEWSMTALSIDPSIQLFSFEPNPIVFKELASNLSCFSVNLFNKALSSQLGKRSFHYAVFNNEGDYFGGSSFYNRDHFRNFDMKIMEVDLETIDNVCDKYSLKNIDFLKIDSEGAELNILMGAQRLINNQSIQAIQFEYGECFRDANTTLKEVFTMLSKNGYVIFRIFQEGLVHLSQWQERIENYVCCNYFAILEKEAPGYRLMSFN